MTYEKRVTDLLNSRFEFRSVRIDDLVERNRLEALLIATVAACDVCQPSSSWLGHHAYSPVVQASGMWNRNHVGGATLSEFDLGRFQQLAGQSRGSGSGEDLSSTLLLMPCCGEKMGMPDPGLPSRSVRQFLGREAIAVLEEGRHLAFATTSLDESSKLRPALAYYSGHPYRTHGLRDLLVDAINRGLHCLIISGGNGVVRPEEPIHSYRAHLSRTRSVWWEKVPEILREYVRRNAIERTFGAFSSGYSAVVPADLTGEDWRAVPSFDPATDEGIALTEVPKKVGQALESLMRAGFIPGDGWVRVINQLPASSPSAPRR